MPRWSLRRGVRKALRRAFALLAVAALVGVVHAGRPLYTHAIADEATWRSLAARPQSAAAARTEVVKFLLDRDDGRLWQARPYRVVYQKGQRLSDVP